MEDPYILYLGDFLFFFNPSILRLGQILSMNNFGSDGSNFFKNL
jgi:hypothetical protein